MNEIETDKQITDTLILRQYKQVSLVIITQITVYVIYSTVQTLNATLHYSTYLQNLSNCPFYVCGYGSEDSFWTQHRSVFNNTKIHHFPHLVQWPTFGRPLETKTNMNIFKCCVALSRFFFEFFGLKWQLDISHRIMLKRQA